MNKNSNNNILQKVITDIKKVCNRKKYSLHEPEFGKSDLRALEKCLKSTYVSTSGPNIQKFELALKKKTGARVCIATINATSGLYLSLKALGINSSHEVLVPTLTFIGSVNPISYCGAIPHFIDVSDKFYDLDYKKIDEYLNKITIKKNNYFINKKTKKIIRCIIPVHLFGHPCEMDQCLKLAKKYNLLIIEDCSEALGSKYKGRHVGTFGNCGVISFNGNKIITTGGGGAVITNSLNLSKKISHLANVAKKYKNLEISHDKIGYNYRLPNLNSSLGLSQLKNLNYFIKKKRFLYQRYYKAFLKNNYLNLMKEPANSKSNYWLQSILIKKKYANLKNKLIISLIKKNILARPVWKLIHTLKPYKNCPKMSLMNAKEGYKRIIHLPSSSNV